MPVADSQLATLTETHHFFRGEDEDYKLTKFREHWAQFGPAEKTQIRTGIGNGTLTY